MFVTARKVGAIHTSGVRYSTSGSQHKEGCNLVIVLDLVSAIWEAGFSAESNHNNSFLKCYSCPVHTVKNIGMCKESLNQIH